MHPSKHRKKGGLEILDIGEFLDRFEGFEGRVCHTKDGAPQKAEKGATSWNDLDQYGKPGDDTGIALINGVKMGIRFRHKKSLHCRRLFVKALEMQANYGLHFRSTLQRWKVYMLGIL